jgi:hypothetical protein
VIGHHWDGLPLPAEEVVILQLEATADGLQLTVDAPFAGDPPPAHPPGSTPALWEHEVVELFVADAAEVTRWEASGADPAAGPPYCEIELGPHGHYLVLQLDAVRRPRRLGIPIRYQAAVAPAPALPRPGLPPSAPPAPAGEAAAPPAPTGDAVGDPTGDPVGDPAGGPASGRRWHGQALVPWSELPAGVPGWVGNAHAIRRGVGSDRLHASLFAGPGEHPDFHLPHRFRPLFAAAAVD